MRAGLNVLKYIAVFIMTVAVAAALLVAAALIPRDAIRNNMTESAEFLRDGELFGEKIKGVDGSKIDRYADSILLGIAYQYDSGHPLESVMKSAYYYTEYQNENVNLYDAVTGGYEANQQYMRYWHGSIAVVRPLMMFFNIQQIYIINAVIIAGLTAWLMVILIRNKAYLPAVAAACGLVLTSSWYVPMSLEYTWTYIIMLFASCIGTFRAFKGNMRDTGLFFMITGMITSYMDFLTTETLTLLIPLLLIIWIDIRNEGHADVKKILKSVLFWSIGYIGMWLMKWGLAAVILRENVMSYITGHVRERLGGDIGIAPWRYYVGAVTRNIRHLFPWEYGPAGIAGGVFIILGAIYTGYVYKRKNINKCNIYIYLILAIIPYIRYIVLHNHSYVHSFFTYRAQMATIMAVVLIVGETAGFRHNT